MIEYNIPGYKKVSAEYLVLDYNGTLAVDGLLIPQAGKLLREIAGSLQVCVVTADTFGKAREQLEGLSCSLRILDPGNQDLQKEQYVRSLGAEKVIAVGNGRNDNLMLKASALGIAVVQAEGAAAITVINADIVCTSITDALSIIINPLRVVATLRS